VFEAMAIPAPKIAHTREWLLPQLEAAYGQIREAALVDPHKPFSNEEFELAVLKLTAVIESRRADVHEQAKGSR
jgi:hypothetical protein